MGKLNILQSKFDGKVGQFVGAKWKNLATVRAYQPSTDPKTQAQLKQRTFFKPLQEFCSAIAPLVKPYTNLDTSKQYLQNALVSFNKNKRNNDNTVKFTEIQFSRAYSNCLQRTSYARGTTTFDITYRANLPPEELAKYSQVVVLFTNSTNAGKVYFYQDFKEVHKYSRTETGSTFGYIYSWLIRKGDKYKRCSNTVGYYYS